MNESSGHSLQFATVSHSFSAQNQHAGNNVVEGIDLDVRPGEFVSLVGASGCGKTTLLNMAAGLVTPQQGTVLINGSATRTGDPEVGYLLARDLLLPWRTAERNVALPLEALGIKPGERTDRAREMLAHVGLRGYENFYPASLSHGMRQRVAVARTLVANPRTLLLDEPFSALDAETRLRLQGMFLSIWEKRRNTVLFVTHDLAESIILSDRIVVLSSRPGQIKEEFIVSIPRPRDVLDLQGSGEYHRLFEEIWRVLKEEVQFHD